MYHDIRMQPKFTARGQKEMVETRASLAYDNLNSLVRISFRDTTTGHWLESEMRPEDARKFASAIIHLLERPVKDTKP